MQKNIEQNKKKHKGHVALISMLIIAALGLSIVSSLVLLGIGSSRTSIVLGQATEARALVNACAEEALKKIWDSDFYYGSGSLISGQGNCTYVVSGSTLPKTITVSGAAGNVLKNISITVDQLHPYLHISTWQDIP